MQVFPYFRSHYSIGRSLFTLDAPEDKISETSPISLFTVAQQHKLNNIVLVDSSFSGFVSFYKGCKDHKINGIFGILFNLVNDITEKSEDSLNTANKVVIFMKNSDGYKDLCKLYTAIFTNKDSFYYYERGDWQTIKKYWTDNLLLVIPFYDSFLHKNLLHYEGHAIPDFGKIKPFFWIENHSLPYTERLTGVVLDYCAKNNYDCVKAHQCLYYKEDDFKAYQVLRAIDNRTTFSRPDINYLASNKFSFESFNRENSIS